MPDRFSRSAKGGFADAMEGNLCNGRDDRLHRRVSGRGAADDALCERYGISRDTGYRLLGRYREAVLEGEKTLKLAKQFQNSNVFYFRMALGYFKLGDKKSFARFRALCKKLFPDDTWNGYLEKLA